MMNSKELDQFYTKDEVALSCMRSVREVLATAAIAEENVFYLEPSAGGGAFLRAISADWQSVCFGCDLDPHCEGVHRCDFLREDVSRHLPSARTIVVVGNPPFGSKGKLASAFINRALEYSQIVCFVLPIQFNKYSGHSQIVPQAKLVFNAPLPRECFVFNSRPYSVRACFQVWTTCDIPLPDQRIRSAPRREHPDFEMFQYNCTEEALKYFDRQVYRWDFAVPRQGFKDYRIRETDPNRLDRRIQWIFFRAKNARVLSRLKKLDFEKLSQKNSTIPGFGKADVVEEYTRLFPKK